MNNNNSFGIEKINTLPIKLAPPIMLAQLIQALYNIIDSYYVGKFSRNGIAALSVIFPIQLLISALAIGTGVGINTVMSRLDGISKRNEADITAGSGLLLSIISWVLFAFISLCFMKTYCQSSLAITQAQDFACTYGKIVCFFSFGIFLESGWTKILQARGDMKAPMFAQIIGAATNIILDYLLIFGIGFCPKLGITGAAIATVTGQILAAIIVGYKVFQKIPKLTFSKKYIKPICKAGLPNILMNALCTIYIVALNLILVQFSNAAVTVLGLYYKLQSFCLIPAMGLTTCIIPILSYNYAARKINRCQSILHSAIIISALCMARISNHRILYSYCCKHSLL